MSNSKLLASGYGVGSPCTSTAWKYAVIAGFLCFVACLILAFIYQEQKITLAGIWGSDSYTSYKFGTRSYYFVAIGIGLCILDLILGYIVSKKIEATKISVYEDKVYGAAVDKDFSMAKLIFMGMGWFKSGLINFDLTLNQITSVDMEANHAVIINTSGTQYKCFASNASEIRDAINNKVRYGKETAQNTTPDTRKVNLDMNSLLR